MITQNEVKKTCYKYTIATFEQEREGKTIFSAQLFNDNAKKEYNRLVTYYNYRSQEQRDQQVANWIANITGHEKRKEERKAEKKAMTNHAEIGDILVNSWGYEQTNTDFYQVIKLTKKGVYIKEIAHRLESEEGLSSMAGYTYPVKDLFLDKPEKFCVCKSTNRSYSVAVGKYNFQSATLTDPKERHYCSWYA